MTVRRRDGLPSFRQQRVLDLVHALMRKKNDGAFQIVHYSIQSNHIHLVSEARDRRVVTRKMQGFMIAFAKRLNAMLDRAGKVWADRYYARDVQGSREMKNVLAYVFGNAQKQPGTPRSPRSCDALVIDSASSAWAFDGWDTNVEKPPDHLRWKPPRPRTDLLKKDWIVYGLLPLSGAPKSAR